MLSRTRFIPAPSCHIVRARGFHRPAPAAAGGLLGKLFGGRKPEEPKSSETSSPAVGDSVSESGTGTENMGAEQTRLEALASRAPNESIQPKFPKRAYSPARLEFRIQEILRLNEVSLESPDWRSTSLAEKNIKLKVLSDVMKHVKLPVSNRALNNIRSVGDLLDELAQKPVSKDAGHPVAQFYQSHAEELPANMKFEPFAKHTRKLHAHQ